jgi:hypothetical protein
MRKSIVLWVLFLALLTAAGCQPGQSPEIAQTGPESPTLTQTLSRTLSSPSATPTPELPTAAATATVTRTPRPLPPVPTADFAPQDFYGTWTVFDREAGGPNFLKFYEDGTYTVHHGPTQNLLHSGKYTLDGRLLTFQDFWYCPEDQRVGSYLIKMGANKDYVVFEPYDDPCRERANDFRSRIVRWNRFVPTPEAGSSATP